MYESLDFIGEIEEFYTYKGGKVLLNIDDKLLNNVF
jgi:hypothetical protein